MDLRLTIKAKLVITADAVRELKSTMEEFNRACNTLSIWPFSKICSANTTFTMQAIT